jgi:hypothetical protein
VLSSTDLERKVEIGDREVSVVADTQQHLRSLDTHPTHKRTDDCQLHWVTDDFSAGMLDGSTTSPAKKDRDSVLSCPATWHSN